MTPSPRQAPLRFTLLYLVPAALFLAFVVVPLAAGKRTLFLRDTLLTHLSMREGLVAPLRAGEIPLVDPLRGGGQALAGNLNAVALYPDNLLLLAASSLWQLNAHFWIHWLVALGAAFWLARALGWGSPAAAVTAAAYGFGGFFVSQLNLYNGVAPAALAPALAAAAIGARRGSGRALVALALLWALALLGGDPIVAALALVAALILSTNAGDAGAATSEPAEGRDRRPWFAIALALACGTLLAAPQLLLTRALLAESFRGFRGFDAADLAKAAPAPAGLIELLLPLFFGRPDSGVYWGESYFGGTPPLYFSLAPGCLALALAAVALARGGSARWRPGLLAGGGLLLTFSAATPLARLLAALPGMELVRFQAKFALLFAMGAALLAGLGAERLAADADAWRIYRRSLWIGAGGFGLIVVLLAIRPGGLFASFAALFARGLSGPFLDAEILRWAGVALFSALALLVARVAAARAFEARELALPAAVALQAALHLLLLRGIVPTDDAEAFRVPPAVASRLPSGARVVHGATDALFGPGLLVAEGSDPRLAAQVRRAWESGLPFSLHRAGVVTEFDSSPEGLDHFTLLATEDAIQSLPDDGRLRLLRASGVDRLLLTRELEGVPPELATLVSSDAAHSPPLFEYAIQGGWNQAVLLPCATYAPQMNAALARLLAADFDPGREAVIPGNGAPRCVEPGTARVVRDQREAVEFELDAPEGGTLVLRRAVLPIWRAEIDGAPARATTAQMTRLAVEIPVGARRVRLFVDRSPLRTGAILAFAGAIGLAVLGWRARGNAASAPP